MKTPAHIALGLLAFFGTAVFCIPISAATPRLQEKLGTQELSILQNPKFVTILPMVCEPDLTNFPAIKEVFLSRDETEKLKTNILDDHNYDFERVKKCRFFPEISFKFENNEGQVVHLFVSPLCHQMLFRTDAGSLLINYDPAHERIDFFLKQLLDETRMRNETKGR